MVLTLLNGLGEWNPQLVRELKGHLKRRNLFLTVASALVCQLLILVASSQQNCLHYVADKCVELDWQIRWELMFRTLNWILPLLLLVGGVHLLISDLDKEARRGTLNFIRLSPQPSQSILLGKLLGVPALLYLAIALTIPLHWVSALGAGVSLGWLLGIYALWGVGCGVFYSAAAYYTLTWSDRDVSKSLTWAGTFLACFVGFPYISVIDFSFDWYQHSSELGTWTWFLLPLWQQSELMLTWALITLGAGTYWIWQAANRLFTNPSATALSKGQSYWLVASVQIWLLGFAVPQVNSGTFDVQMFIGSFVLFFLNPIGFLMLNGALSPRRQALLDWACYRHKDSSTRKGFWHRSLVPDLMWGEKSPTLVAIAINLLISAAIWIPWIVWGSGQAQSQDNFTTPIVLLGLLLTINVILIYAAIAQLMLFMNRWQQSFWIVSTVGVLGGVPLAIWATFGISPLDMPYMWLLSPLPILTLVNASASTIFLSVLAQLSILGLLTLRLTQQLRKAGESASKALFAEHSSLPLGSIK
jgi:hypothetical protein